MGIAYPRHRPKGFHPEGDARFYDLLPPVQVNGVPVAHVVVSAIPYPCIFMEFMESADIWPQPETCIFPVYANSGIDMLELPGSFRGAMDHGRALAGLGEGYDIYSDAPERC